jgi:chromosome segregation ATPase
VKLEQVTAMTYPEQAKFFLNAFWPELEQEAENCWKFVAGFQKLDPVKGKEGSELDEFWSHKFLETHGDTLTVIQMRAAFKEIDIDFNKRMSFAEYALWKYKQNVKELLSRPQGDNKEEIEQAEAMLKEVTALFEEAERRAEEARAALKEAEAREAEAKAKEADAKAKEADAKAKEAAAISQENDAKAKEADAKAKEADAVARENEATAASAELAAALADLNAQQQAYDNTTAELQAKSESGGLVAQNKAKNELAQHLNTPTLALKKARITQEAAVKKAEKARQLAADARVVATDSRVAASKSRESAEKARQAATSARVEAEKARQAAEEATRQAVAARDRAQKAKQAADDALDEARQKVEEAEAFLAEVKKRPGAVFGSIWWMERELHERRAFLPEKKGGYKKA